LLTGTTFRHGSVAGVSQLSSLQTLNPNPKIPNPKNLNPETKSLYPANPTGPPFTCKASAAGPGCE